MLESVTSWWKGTPASAPPPAAAAKKEFNPSDPKQNPLNPEGLKPCCACPDTKSARDDCFLKHPGDESAERCKWLVKAHLECMRSLGFKV